MMPGVAHLYAVMDATWPAASESDIGPWLIRNGHGGGKRVSAALATRAATPEELPRAEAAMQALDQIPLFMIRQSELRLDAMLGAAGYDVIDPVNIYAAPVGDIATERPPRVTTFAIWEPLAIMRDIWAAGGIGPGRLAVMDRATCPKTGLLGRSNNRPAATAYVGLHEGVAMLHALEVLSRHRREGLGRYMMREAAFWAQAQGASHISVICTKANRAANALYHSLGMTLVGDYHYRIKG